MVLSLAVYGCGDKESRLQKYYGLKGNVKSKTFMRCEGKEKFGEPTIQKCVAGFSLRFDKNGKEVERTELDGSGKVKSKFIYAYNDEGHFIGGAKYSPDGTVLEKSEAELFPTGLVQKLTVRSEDGKLIRTEEFEYNKYGYETAKTVRDTDNKIQSKEVRTYNEKNQEINYKKYDKNGNLSFQVNSTHDENGNTIESDIGGTFEYKFDKQGNWIQKVQYHNGKIIFIYERKIEYY